MISLRHMLRFLVIALGLPFAVAASRAATFPGDARVQINDPTGSLSCSNAVDAMTISCWFRISVPTSVLLANNMVILANGSDGNESGTYSYLLQYNVSNGNIEFRTKGASTPYAKTNLIEHPYLDRWYHVAVVRSGSSFTCYVDGRPYAPEAGAVGSTITTNGMSIGGWGSTKHFYGDIQEVAFFQQALSGSTIRSLMFQDIPTNSFPNLRGYYKLSSSSPQAQRYNNFAPNLPTGTNPGNPAGSGAITFEETDQTGEQSTFDSRKNGGENAIAPLSGAFSWEQTVLARPTPGVAFDFRVGYSSALAYAGADPTGVDPYDTRVLSSGWRHTFETRMIPSEVSSERRLLLWDGAIETWFPTNIASQTVYKTRHKEYRGELKIITGGDFEWTTPERLIYRFYDPQSDVINEGLRGRLYEIRDFNSNVVQIAWDSFGQKVTQVTDTAGGIHTFNYDLNNLLTNVSFQGWNVWFGYDGQQRLTNKFVTAPPAYANVTNRWSFAYDATSGLLNRIIDPRGNTNTFVQYDKYGRVTNTVDAIGRTTKTEYGVPDKRKITRTDPGNFPWIESYDRKGHLLAQADPLGNATSYTYDDAGNRTSITEPLGWKTTFSYDSRANVLSQTNALGQIRTWTYHPTFNKSLTQTDPLGNTTTYTYNNTTGNLLTQFDTIGTLVTYTYTTNGLVQTATDANGNVTTFGYNSDGFLTSRTDPAANTTSYSRNEVGWVLSETNALAQVTTYSYDINGNVIQIVDPLSRTFTKTYDPNGNLTAQSDAKAQLTRYGYDAANQRTNMVDRTSTNIWFYTFTTRGETETVKDPLGNIVSNVYDNANRLIKVFDPQLNVVQTDYDANGNPVSVTDKLGQRWTKTYDRVNRITVASDPLGDTKQTTYDAAGRIQQVITPNGFPSLHSYDALGRLTKWVDAEGFNWLYAYDGNGNITDITDALGGHYVMAYGPRNERILEKNQDNFQWTYHYDKLLRPDQQTDPNGTVRTITYDDGGRIDYVDFSTGRQDNHTYDVNNNLTDLSRTKSGQPPVSSHFIYDAMDRAAEYQELTFSINNAVKYGYDALGRVTSLTYPDNKILAQSYDALGQLTNQVDWANRQMKFTYDKANRLVARTYPNGITQSNSFDSAGQLTGLAYGGIAPQPFVTNVPTTGLLAYWRFESGTGVDSSTNGRNATVVGATQTDGMRGPGLYFNGSTTNYVVLNPLSGFPNQELTVAFWVKSTDTSSQYVLSYFTTEDAFRLALDQTGLRIDVDNDSFTQTGVSVSDGNWHHLVVMWRRSDGSTQVYRDGSVSWSGTRSAGVNIASSGAFVLGEEQDSAGGGFNSSFSGSLDEVLIYNRMLSSNEVQQVYQGDPPATSSNRFTIALQYAYDRNGNKTGGTEQGTFDWPQPSKHDETAAYTASGRLQTKTDAASTNNNWIYRYDATGNMTNAVGAGQTFAFTYDEDNRVLTLGWDAGITSKNIQNRYDALGRRISRKVDGTETRYALDLQGDMERILCDMTSSGQITAYYIHGPDLCYKVTPGAPETITCYHADAQANIIALTDAGGTNIAQYVYTPYGRSLGSQSSVFGSQPYLFVGSQGVMEEVPGLYFMRARYYSADTGTFLSTEPRKHIGPTWRPIAYAYGIGNPLAGMDPNGRSFKSFVSSVTKSVAKVVQAVSSGIKQAVTAVANVTAKAVQAVNSGTKQAATAIANAGAKAASVVAKSSMSAVNTVVKTADAAVKSFDVVIQEAQLKVANAYDLNAGSVAVSKEGLAADMPSAKLNDNSGGGVSMPVASAGSVELGVTIKKTRASVSAGFALPIPDIGFQDCYQPSKGSWSQELHFEVGDFGISIERDLSEYIKQRQQYEIQQQLDDLKSGKYVFF